MIMYTLTFYQATYGAAAKIPLDEFPLWEIRARAELNGMTFGRFDCITEQTDNVQMCVCELAEALYEKNAHAGITSENNDGYSVTYAQGGGTENVSDIAKRYLDADLFYRGV